MPIEVLWESHEKRIVRHIYTGVYTPEDVRHSFVKTDQLREEVTPSAVDIIIDMQTRHIPSGIISMRNSLLQHLPDNTQTLVMVGAGTFLSAINTMMQTLIPNLADKFVLVNSIEDAYDVINRRRFSESAD